MDAFKKGWFTETGTLNGDQALSMEVEEVLYHEKSKYQDILVFDRYRIIFFHHKFKEVFYQCF